MYVGCLAARHEDCSAATAAWDGLGATAHFGFEERGASEVGRLLRRPKRSSREFLKKTLRRVLRRIANDSWSPQRIGDDAMRWSLAAQHPCTCAEPASLHAHSSIKHPDEDEPTIVINLHLEIAVREGNVLRIAARSAQSVPVISRRPPRATRTERLVVY